MLKQALSSVDDREDPNLELQDYLKDADDMIAELQNNWADQRKMAQLEFEEQMKAMQKEIEGESEKRAEEAAQGPSLKCYLISPTHNLSHFRRI